LSIESKEQNRPPSKINSRAQRLQLGRQESKNRDENEQNEVVGTAPRRKAPNRVEIGNQGALGWADQRPSRNQNLYAGNREPSARLWNLGRETDPGARSCAETAQNDRRKNWSDEKLWRAPAGKKKRWVQGTDPERRRQQENDEDRKDWARDLKSGAETEDLRGRMKSRGAACARGQEK
jgi:hypothetical protein